jgi:hypothetical protein
MRKNLVKILGEKIVTSSEKEFRKQALSYIGGPYAGVVKGICDAGIKAYEGVKEFISMCAYPLNNLIESYKD